MANKSKKAVKAELRALGVEFETDDYRTLCNLLSEKMAGIANEISDNNEVADMPVMGKVSVKGLRDDPLQVKITNRRKRLKNMFLADAIRDENDAKFLNAEISQRKYKGKLKTITTIKHYDVIDGEWVTEFIIDLKG